MDYTGLEGFHKYRDEIHTSQISILWLRWPKYSSLSAADKSQVVQVVIETVYNLVLTSETPVYLQVTLESGDSSHPVLERLMGNVLHRPIQWVRVPLEAPYS